jgi:hypothetical protein
VRFEHDRAVLQEAAENLSHLAHADLGRGGAVKLLVQLVQEGEAADVLGQLVQLAGARRAGYFTDPRETRGLCAASCGPSIVVMEATEHWEGHDVPLGRALRGDRGQLVDPLVRARGVVVADVLGDDALEVPAGEHEKVVEAFATKRAQKALADGVRAP